MLQFPAPPSVCEAYRSLILAFSVSSNRHSRKSLLFSFGKPGSCRACLKCASSSLLQDQVGASRRKPGDGEGNAHRISPNNFLDSSSVGSGRRKCNATQTDSAAVLLLCNDTGWTCSGMRMQILHAVVEDMCCALQPTWKWLEHAGELLLRQMMMNQADVDLPKPAGCVCCCAHTACTCTRS